MTGHSIRRQNFFGGIGAAILRPHSLHRGFKLFRPDPRQRYRRFQSPHFSRGASQDRGVKSSPRGIPMSSTTNYFEKYLRSARKKYGSDTASIIVIVFGVAALLILLCPR